MLINIYDTIFVSIILSIDPIFIYFVIYTFFQNKILYRLGSSKALGPLEFGVLEVPGSSRILSPWWSRVWVFHNPGFSRFLDFPRSWVFKDLFKFLSPCFSVRPEFCKGKTSKVKSKFYFVIFSNKHYKEGDLLSQL